MMGADDAFTKWFIEMGKAIHGIDPSVVTGGSPSELVADSSGWPFWPSAQGGFLRGPRLRTARLALLGGWYAQRANRGPLCVDRGTVQLDTPTRVG